MVIFLYHIGMLFHFTKELSINIPYFLLMILQNMSHGVHRTIKNPYANLHHYGLIKLLNMGEFGIRNNSWDNCL